FGGGYYGGGGTACTTDECRRKSGIIVGSIIGGLVGLSLLICSIVLCYKHGKCRNPCAGRPFRNNSIFVKLPNLRNRKQQGYGISPFQSGIWSSRYFQYGRWHGPCQFSLSFDQQSMKVTGSGTDDVGTFTIDGIYSSKTHRIGLTKTYQRGTGNPSENLGHRVIIQLTWNAQNNQFEGKWYVQKNRYHGEAKFELVFNGEQQPPAYNSVSF
ncbi:unnamed protein product, partial [Rotaria sordida]